MSVVKVSRRSLSEKLVLAGGVVTLSMAPGNSAEAAIVTSASTPKSPQPANVTVPWDVDGDGNIDFTLLRTIFRSSGTYTFGFLTEVGGARLVGPTGVGSDAFAKLDSGVQVGATMAGFQFFSNPRDVSITSTRIIGGDAENGGWTLGETGFFGFKFTTNGDTYYGWGEISILGTNPAYIITRAFYDNTPGAAITVGDTGGGPVPEPSACVLALLAAGGVAAYKMRRKQGAM